MKTILFFFHLNLVLLKLLNIAVILKERAPSFHKNIISLPHLVIERVEWFILGITPILLHIDTFQLVGFLLQEDLKIGV